MNKKILMASVFFIIISSATVSANWSNWSPFWEINRTFYYDINLDGCISILDLVFIANCFDDVGDPGWIIEDVNDDGCISILDLMIVAVHFDECIGE